MPSITIRFQWDGHPTEQQRRQTMRDLTSHLQYRIGAAYAAGGEDLLGYDGALVDRFTLDVITDDGEGITAADRTRFADDDETDAKARARADDAADRIDELSGMPDEEE